MHELHTVFFYLARWLGLSDINGSWYAFWSGVGSDIGEITIVAAVLHHLRSSKRHNDKLQRHIDRKFSKLTNEESN